MLSGDADRLVTLSARSAFGRPVSASWKPTSVATPTDRSRVARSAAAASTIPAPQVLVVQLASGNGRAEPASIPVTAAASSSGRNPVISETMPLTTGAARLVPWVPTTVGAAGTVVPVLSSASKSLPSPPGAAMLTRLPKLEYDALAPLRPMAATAITPGQSDGVCSALVFLLPADATTILPAAITWLMALR